MNNIWIKNTLKIWDSVQKQLKGRVALSRAMPIIGNIEFIPSIWDGAYKRWAEKGLKTINQLFEGNIFRSFQQLKQKFDLPTTDLYRYLQIRNYITKHKDWEDIKKAPNNIDSHFIDVSERPTPAKKQLSCIYKKLSLDMSDNTLHIKRQWETELNIGMEEDIWKEICVKCHGVIQSQLWKEFDWKVKMRFFRTPKTACPYKENSDDKCWRNCNMIGDHTHVFWACPKIQSYWRKIKQELDNIFKRDIPLEPQVTLLDSMNTHIFETDQGDILHVLLMVARKMITINWKNPNPPTVEQWKQKLKQVHKMEYMTAKLQFINGQIQ